MTGKLYVTGALHRPGAFGTVILPGQVIVGGCTSSTVTVNVQVAVPQALVAVAVTVVVPTGKKVPEACEYVITGTGKPVAVAV